jgi:hypothetical protein
MTITLPSYHQKEYHQSKKSNPKGPKKTRLQGQSENLTADSPVAAYEKINLTEEVQNTFNPSSAKIDHLQCF